VQTVPTPILPPKSLEPSRTTSLVSAVSCLEAQSTAAFTPRNDDPIVNVCRLRMERFKKLINDPEFVYGHQNRGVKVWHLEPKGEPLIAKGHIIVPNVPSVSFALECLSTCPRIQQWNTDLLDHRTIKTFPVHNNMFLSERISQDYNAYKGKMGFPGRDFLWYSYVVWEDVDTAFVIHFSDFDSSDDNPQASGRFVRARALISGYRVQRVNGDLSIYFINQVDPGTNLVPDWIINSVMKKTPERLSALSEYILTADRSR
jgi:hypothetical protein